MNKQNPTEDAQKVLDFFTDMMETSKTHLKYYLSEDVVLDWFGHTVKGQKKVASFIKTTVNPIRHLFKEAKSTSKIGFRDTHLVKGPKYDFSRICLKLRSLKVFSFADRREGFCVLAS